MADRLLVFASHRSGSMLTRHVLEDLAKVSGLRHFPPESVWKKRAQERRDPGIYGPFRVVAAVSDKRIVVGPRDGAKVAMWSTPGTKVVVSVRDPRDVLVSMFYAYCFSHQGPVPGGTGYRAEVAARGIDDFVLRMAAGDSFPYEGRYGTGGDEAWRSAGNVRERHERLLSLAERPNATLLTYEEMVDDFGAWLRPLAAAADVDRPSVIAELMRRHGNFSPQGQFAHRRHVQPGDYRNKLKPETIARLDEVFERYFRRQRKLAQVIAGDGYAPEPLRW